MLPPGLAAPAVGLATEAALPLIGVIGQGIASAVDPAARAYRKQLKKDISAMEKGKLGLSEAEKRAMLAGTQKALQAQTASAEANLRRSAAAAGGFGRSGAQQAAMGQIGAAQRETLAGAAGRVDELSQDVAQQRFQDIMRRLNQRRQEAMQTGAAAAQGTMGALVGTAAAYPGLKKDYEDYQKKLKEEADKAAAEAARQAAASGQGSLLKSPTGGTGGFTGYKF